VFPGAIPLTMTTEATTTEATASVKIEDKSSAQRYALAVAAALAALLLRLALSPWYGTGFAFQTTFAAIAFTAWYCGVGPSIVATLIGMLGSWYWFLPPVNSFALKDSKTEIPGMIGRFVLAGLIIAVGGANRRSKARLEREIAARVKMTAEATAATAKFRAVFEQTTVFAGIMTLDGTLIDINRLSLEACGYRAEDVLGKPFWETGWWRNFQESQEKIRTATPQAAQGIPYRETLRYSWADGTEHVVDFALHPIRDPEGNVLFLHPTGIDITDLKNVEVELRKSHEELEQRVEERTHALAASFASLEAEIVLRKTTEKALRELSARTLRLQDEERRRFARDLHDSTGQTLVAVKMALASVAGLVSEILKAPPLLNDLEALADQALQEIRTTSHLLHPPMLDEVGFSSAAQWYMDEFSKRSGLKTSLVLSARPQLTKDEELVFFRILQESLTNVLRHSGSAAVDICLSSDKQDAILSIRDYGKGLPPETLHSFREMAAGVGVGLGGMKQRVRELGGHLRVESDGSGTCVTATLPLSDTAPSRAEDVKTRQPSTAA
jgi:PAS domain S-box-containing protein